ncbi:glycosyltransferase family 2 protein [Geomonas azotofigens]|uniref:glycosyltransferase family 2 protein n=1 Tax=Geomonas azotofigens TaxID=2843196 RepID=UPI001C122917|nr:glycosyltransferase [Geomonas azotofigens]MBU5613494.1 glycosyltransferase [Geomonas azotofigens]
MDISIVIPTYNNSRRLMLTLSHFAEWVKFPDAGVELVVVNNNSRDDTDEVVRAFVGRLPIKLVVEPRQGISRAKNAGIANAAGKLLIFTDDDVMPGPMWVEAYWEAYLRDSKHYFWGGSVISDFEAGPPNAEILKFAPPSVSGMDLGAVQRCIEPPEYFIGANWACPREALRDVGVFNESLGLNPSQPNPMVGEETDLMDRLRCNGYRGWYLPEATVHHFVPSSKGTVKHVADRKEGFGYYSHLGKATPRWAYRSYIENGIKSFFYRIFGKDHSAEYILYKEAKGVLRAARANLMRRN